MLLLQLSHHIGELIEIMSPMLHNSQSYVRLEHRTLRTNRQPAILAPVLNFRLVPTTLLFFLFLLHQQLDFLNWRPVIPPEARERGLNSLPTTDFWWVCGSTGIPPYDYPPTLSDSSSSPSSNSWGTCGR